MEQLFISILALNAPTNLEIILKVQGGPKVMCQRFELIARLLNSDHLIRKIFSGLRRDSQWFEEYLKIIEIGDYFSDERSFFAFFTPLTCLDHIPLGLPLFGPSGYESTVKIRAPAYPVSEIDHKI